MPYIALDAGHGTDTFERTGGKGIRYDDGKVFEEHDFNATVVKYAKELAEYNGFKVLLPQPLFEREVPLIERTNLANREGVDVYWSVHANAGPPDATGACSFYWHSAQDSLRLAQIWRDYSANTPVGLHGDGLHAAKPDSWTNLHVCRATNMTAILSEYGFFTNESDRQYLLDDDYRRLCAENIVRSLCDYFGMEFKKPVEKESVTVTIGGKTFKITEV